MKKVEKDIIHFVRVYNILRNLPVDTLIIVEGKSDKKALMLMLDDTREIITIREFKERLNTMNISKNVLILTDFDQEGESYAKMIREYLRDIGGIRILDEERILFHKITRSYGEEIYSIFKSLINKIRLYSYDSLDRMINIRY